MDFPKSVPGVGLVGGQFVDENQATGQVGSLIPAKWGNDVTTELLGVIDEAGLEPDEENPQQLRGAVLAIVDKVAPVATKAEAETSDEATANNVKRMTPLRVLQAIKARLINATEAAAGMLRLGTQAEVDAGVLDNVAVTPAKIKSYRSIGAGQTWQNVTASRAANTVYTNTTGRPIMVKIITIATWPGARDLLVNGASVDYQAVNSTWNGVISQFAIVPAGATYQFGAAPTPVNQWMELR